MLTVTGYKNLNGKDLGTLFVAGNSGIVTGYKISSGADLGTLFVAGVGTLTTGYKNSSGADLGTLFEALIVNQWLSTVTYDNTATTKVYIGDIAIDGKNAVAVSSGSAAGFNVWYSNDAGKNWVSVTPPILNGVYLQYASMSGNYVLATDYYTGGVYRSIDAGITWTKQLADTTLPTGGTATISISGSRAIYAGTGGLYYSTDYGSTWTLSNINTPKWAVSISGLNAIAIPTVVTGVNYLYSTNGGQTWSQSTRQSVNTYVAYCYINGLYAVVAYSNTGVTATAYRSSNGGQTWTAFYLSGTSNANINKLCIDGSNVVAGTSGTGGVWLSTDYGVSWARLGGINSNYASISGNNIVATGYGYRNFYYYIIG